MKLAFDLLQALGVGAAIGMRPFLPALLVGALAAADLGVDYEGTDYSYLEKAPFLLVLLLLLVAVDFVRRRSGDEKLERGTGFIALAVLAAAIAAQEGAGTLADHGHSPAAGAVIAVAAALLGLWATRPLFARVRTRLEDGGMLSLFREAAALAAAGLAVLFPPLAIVIVAALVWLAAGGRRREGEKYAGLRILR